METLEFLRYARQFLKKYPAYPMKKRQVRFIQKLVEAAIDFEKRRKPGRGYLQIFREITRALGRKYPELIGGPMLTSRVAASATGGVLQISKFALAFRALQEARNFDQANARRQDLVLAGRVQQSQFFFTGLLGPPAEFSRQNEMFTRLEMQRQEKAYPPHPVKVAHGGPVGGGHKRKQTF